MQQTKIDELVSRLKAEFRDDPSAELEDFALEMEDDSSEDTFQCLLVAIALAKFRKDTKREGYFSREIVYSDGATAGVKCSLYRGHGEDDFISDGFGEAEAQSSTVKALSVAARRALKQALSDAGYGVPCWVTFKGLAEKQVDIEGNASDAVAVIETERPQVLPMPEPTPEEPPKRRGRKPKVLLETQPQTELPQVETHVAEATEESIPVTAEPTTSAPAPSIWDSIPDDGLSNEEIVAYLPQISFDEAASCVCQTGRFAGKTMGEIANTNSPMVKVFAEAMSTAGTKLRLSAMKVREVKGL